MNLETFWEQFEKVEARTKALTLRFGTLQLYAILRTRIFYAIAGELGIFENPHPNFVKGESIADTRSIKSLDGVPRADVVVVPFRRRVAGAEPYSDTVRSSLQAQGKSVLTIDFGPNDIEGLGDENHGESRSLDLEALKEFFAKSEAKAVERIMRFTSRRPQVNSWQKLIATFETEFCVTLEKFNRYPQWVVRRTLAEQRGFARFFRKIGAKNLYIVNAYSEPSIVLGAHRAGMRVHEIQHGFISKFHPAYSFGSSKAPKLNSAPDRILTWGSYWGSGVPLAKGTELVVSGPTRAFRAFRDLAVAENRVVANQVLFTSQGAIATALFDAALETARLLPNFKVIYRLHPNEALADFEGLLKGQEKPKNFELSHREPIFLDLVSQSEYLIGAFSTTIFEGLALGCKALVLPLPGFENMKPAIDAGDITLISSLENLPAALTSARRAEHPEKYYSKEDHARFV
jgi:hypothetical protein